MFKYAQRTLQKPIEHSVLVQIEVILTNIINPK